MAEKDLINLGIAPDSGTGDSARRGGEKINTLFADIYSNLGDNPIGVDPEGPFYGYRRPFEEFEYKVGEIHAAGKTTLVNFEDDSELGIDDTYGWGVNSSGNYLRPAANSAPYIYRNTMWYFLSRGERITADLSQLADDSDSVVHMVLPLASAGDTVIVRDSLGSWGEKKRVSFWTTPYEFNQAENPETTLQEWQDNTPGISSTFDADVQEAIIHNSVSIFNGTEFVNASYKQVDLSGVGSIDSDILFAGTGDNTSPITYQDRKNYEFIFTYQGATEGWVVQLRNIISGGDIVFQHNTDTFQEGDWIEWTGLDLVADGGIEISTGDYILPININTAGDVADFGNIPTGGNSQVPLVRVYRQMDDSEMSPAVERLSTEIASLISSVSSNEQRTRLQNVQTRFDRESSADVIKEVNVSAFVSTGTLPGGYILISSYRFNGFANIYSTGG